MQQEEIKPDYNYILNQASPDPVKHKKSKFAYIIIGSLLFFTIVVTLLVLTARPQNKVAVNFTDPAFVLDVKNDRHEQAYGLLSEDIKGAYESQQAFSDTVTKPMQQTFSSYQCNISKQEITGGKYTSHVYNCSKEETEFWIGLGTIENTDQNKSLVHKLCPISFEEMTQCI
jgi:hypothetical protein